mmetsp:Transcript_35786/g.78357  ORF Transcript_35786/g.78357 Transcript_35786/m.78357 type:complete len:323 (-) Transcript_35786:46-1014(-)
MNLAECGCGSYYTVSLEQGHEVNRLFRGRSNREVQGEEVVLVGLGHVDLNAAHENQVATAKICVHDGEHLVLHNRVGLLGELYHGGCGLLDLEAVRRQLGSQPGLLHVMLCAHASSHVMHHLVVGRDHCAASGGEAAVSLSEVLTDVSVRRKADVGAEENEDVPIFWHVRGKCGKACLAHKGRTTDAAEGENCAEVVLEDVWQMPDAVVNLVRAQGLAVDGVVLPQAIRIDGLGYPGCQSNAGESTWKGPLHAPEEGRARHWCPAQPRADLLLCCEGRGEALMCFTSPEDHHSGCQERADARPGHTGHTLPKALQALSHHGR